MQDRIGLFTPPIHDVLASVAVSSFSRVNADLPLVFGQHGSWYRWWAGPRLFYSRVSEDLALDAFVVYPAFAIMGEL